MKQIVLVDDEAQVVQALKREIFLANPQSDYEVLGFTHPAEALNYVDNHSSTVFLVISDLRMPEMKGSEFLVRMRNKHKHINSVLLTAYADLDNIQKAVQTSLQGLIMKPWTTDSIMFEIEKALSSWELRKENEELRKNISQLLFDAGDFQKQLFASSVPQFVSGTLSIAYEPMDQYGAGGDFFEIKKTTNGYCILLGDVSGHGPKSAIVAGMMKSLIHSLYKTSAFKFSLPHLLIEELNEELAVLLNKTPDVLVALFAMFVNTHTNELVVCNAGLPGAFMYEKGRVFEVGNVQPPLAAISDQVYSKNSYNFGSDSRLYLFTDGLHESASQLEGTVSMQAILKDIIIHMNSGTLLNFGTAHEILEVIKREAGLEHLDDDLTFISLSPGEQN